LGELLHLDGSRHRWLALGPEQWVTLIAVVDDATKRLLYAQLHEGGESVEAIMTALRAVLEHEGVPMALYTDRAHWAVHPPVAGGGPDRRRLTHVGRALARRGIEHILGYSPAARGRSERVNRTLQDRLVNELRVAGIATIPAANRYRRERFLPAFNAEFARPPADPASAFVPLGRVDLDPILGVEDERVVGRDNVVTLAGVARQWPSSPAAAPARACGFWPPPSRRAVLALVRHPLPGAVRRPRPRAAGGVIGPCSSPCGHFTVSNSCGQITYQQQPAKSCLPVSW
jgi:hypothetical protein